MHVPAANFLSFLFAGKEKKRVDKVVAELQASQPEKQSTSISPETLRYALDQIMQEKDVPTSPADREQYFMTNVGSGEAMATKG